MRTERGASPVRITLLTDFGTADGYVAAMRGVIAELVPDARIDDASHEIDPGDIESAAWVLARYALLYPEDSIHVVVVDPGVGTERRAVAARVDSRFFVAPDNGVLTRILHQGSSASIREIRNAEYRRPRLSRTFHGRDVLAPAAAHLANGVPMQRFGPAVHDPVLLALREAERAAEGIRGSVVHVDRFGNLITNIPGGWIRETDRCRVSGTGDIPLRETYGRAERGELFAVVGSAETLEISVRDGSAALRLAAGRGDEVRVLSS